MHLLPRGLRQVEMLRILRSVPRLAVGLLPMPPRTWLQTIVRFNLRHIVRRLLIITMMSVTMMAVLTMLRERSVLRIPFRHAPQTTTLQEPQDNTQQDNTRFPRLAST
jgi:hypothetical protein